MEQNNILLRGTLQELPKFSHENHGRRFYKFFLEVPRLSGTVDILPIIAQEHTVFRIDPTAGSMLTVSGQIRSHNIRQDSTRHLLIFVFATDIVAEDGEPVNEAHIEGPICRAPTYRRTPLGREICDVMLCVPRAFHRADYIPCILWGRTAFEVSDCPVRQVLSISGRLQSRIYNKVTESGTEERTAYELSALTADILDDSSGI